MREPIVIIAEPLLRQRFSQYGMVGPLAAQLAQRFDVAVASPAIGPDARRDLLDHGVEPISGKQWFLPPRSDRDEPPSFAQSWLSDALLGTNSRWLEDRLRHDGRLRLNFSMTTAVPSDLWYIQSQPLAVSVRAIIPNLANPMRLFTQLGLPVVDLLDERHLRKSARGAGKLYSSSRYVAECYEKLGYSVSGQIPPFLHPANFRATTRAPSRDYALVYLGKETDTPVVRELIRLGMPVRLFGGKSAQWVRNALGNELPPNVLMCGHVSHEELCELYTNALFTAFPFTDESFGLVPVESMACGTPVLTYASQGPGETVVDGFTGWLAHGRRQFIEAARRLFHRRYPSGMQSACVERAQWFSLEHVAQVWRDTILSLLEGSEPETPLVEPLARPQPGPDAFLSMRELVGLH